MLLLTLGGSHRQPASQLSMLLLFFKCAAEKQQLQHWSNNYVHPSESCLLPVPAGWNMRQPQEQPVRPPGQDPKRPWMQASSQLPKAL